MSCSRLERDFRNPCLCMLLCDIMRTSQIHRGGLVNRLAQTSVPRGTCSCRHSQDSASSRSLTTSARRICLDAMKRICLAISKGVRPERSQGMWKLKPLTAMPRTRLTNWFTKPFVRFIQPRNVWDKHVDRDSCLNPPPQTSLRKKCLQSLCFHMSGGLRFHLRNGKTRWTKTICWEPSPYMEIKRTYQEEDQHR